MSGLALSVPVARDRLGPLAGGRDDEAVVGAYARAVWSVLTEPGDRIAGALVGTFGAAAALEAVGSARFGARALEDAGVSPEEVAAGRRRWWPRLGDAELALANARRAGATLVVPGDDAWPSRADDLGPFAPLCLWIRGDPSALGAPCPAVAVVGARAATGYGEHVAGELAAEAAGGDVVVYSGGAYGIDAAAHRAVLAAGGTTVAVMAGGIERPYPAGHADLLSRVAATGAVVAEVACGTAPTRHRFLARNRLIAALSDATVVVEAGWRSGALNTAHHAQALGRPVGVVPGPVTSVICVLSRLSRHFAGSSRVHDVIHCARTMSVRWVHCRQVERGALPRRGVLIKGGRRAAARGPACGKFRTCRSSVVSHGRVSASNGSSSCAGPALPLQRQERGAASHPRCSATGRCPTRACC